MNKVLPGTSSIIEELKPFKGINLIVTDIDGTLIGENEDVKLQIKKLLNFLRSKGIQITIATGRTYYGAKPLLEALEIEKGMPIVLYNGGVVLEYQTVNVLFETVVPVEVVSHIKNIIDLEEINLYLYQFSTNKSIFIYDEYNMIQEKVFGFGPRVAKMDVNGLEIFWLNDDADIKLSPNAVLIEKRQMSVEQTMSIVQYLKKIPEITFTDSGNGFIEIKGKSLDKGIIFEILKNQNKYPVNKILAIGDNDNDIELFRFADLSVAVANSSPMAIESADYLCLNESASGFLDMLNVIKNAKKYESLI